MVLIPNGPPKVGLRGGDDRVGSVAVAIAVCTADLLRDLQDANALREAKVGEGLVALAHVYQGGAAAQLRITLKIEVCTAEDVQAARDLLGKSPEGSA